MRRLTYLPQPNKVFIAIGINIGVKIVNIMVGYFNYMFPHCLSLMYLIYFDLQYILIM